MPGPNAVWHIDGNHKLIRWRFVIHGGIDGYSRTIVYMRCSDNNRADTVFSSFHAAVCGYGLPSCIRSDLGGKNVTVWRYMIEQQCAVITGSSTHNERIERLWRDVYCYVGVLFHEVFYTLEENGKLMKLIYFACIWFSYHRSIGHLSRSLSRGIITQFRHLGLEI